MQGTWPNNGQKNFIKTIMTFTMVLYIYIISKFIITYIVNKISPKPTFNVFIKILRTICLAFLCCVVL